MKPKNVLIVEPRGNQDNVFSMYNNMPMLGPLILGRIASDAGYDVTVHNENMSGPISPDELATSDYLLVSALTLCANRGKQIGMEYKRVRDGELSKSIVGGMHASTLPSDFEPYFDHVVCGEGEEVLIPLLKGDLTAKIIRAPLVKDLDSVPAPDYSLLRDNDKVSIHSISASRGCPERCTFCVVSRVYGGTYRFQSPNKTLEALRQYAGKSVFFADDWFAANESHTEKLLDMIIAEDLGILITNQLRAQTARNGGLMEKQAQAGVEASCFGFETISQADLKAMGKRQSVDDIVNAIKVSHSNGIKVHGMFILGRDSETLDSIKSTSRFVAEQGLDYVQYGVTAPFPMTPDRNRYAKDGRILPFTWECYDGLHVIVKPANMSPFQLQMAMMEAYSDFYSIGNGIKQAAKYATAKWLGRVSPDMPQKAFDYHPALVRIFGSRVIKSWLRQNQEFLERLKGY